MAVFLYTALDATSSFVKGRVNGSTLKKATSNLESQGFLVVSIKKERKEYFAKANVMLSRVGATDKIFFTRHLYTLLESGISLDQAIHITAEQATNPKFKEILKDVHKKVQAGQSLFIALSEHKKYFSDFFINLIHVGERSGKLDDVLLHLLEQQENDHELRTKVRGAMVYPIIIITAAIGVVVFMMAFVVPQITAVLGEYNVKLPLSTRILIAVSTFLRHYGIVVVPLMFFIIPLGLRLALQNKRFKREWHREKLRIPLLKRIVAEFNLARISRSMSSLMKSGMPIDQALKLTATVPNNVLYKASLEAGIPFIQKGIQITEVLKGYPELYPPITLRMTEVGERTGKLDHMFDRLAAYYEKSVVNTLGSLSTIIEPFLLVFIGLIVAFIALAILTPIWKFSDTI